MRLRDLLGFKMPELPEEWKIVGLLLLAGFVAVAFYFNYKAGIKWTVLLGIEEADWERRERGSRDEW